MQQQMTIIGTLSSITEIDPINKIFTANISANNQIYLVIYNATHHVIQVQENDLVFIQGTCAFNSNQELVIGVDIIAKLFDSKNKWCPEQNLVGKEHLLGNSSDTPMLESTQKDETELPKSSKETNNTSNIQPETNILEENQVKKVCTSYANNEDASDSEKPQSKVNLFSKVSSDIPQNTQNQDSVESITKPEEEPYLQNKYENEESKQKDLTSNEKSTIIKPIGNSIGAWQPPSLDEIDDDPILNPKQGNNSKEVTTPDKGTVSVEPISEKGDKSAVEVGDEDPNSKYSEKDFEC